MQQKGEEQGKTEHEMLKPEQLYKQHKQDKNTSVSKHLNRQCVCSVWEIITVTNATMWLILNAGEILWKMKEDAIDV